MRNNSNEKQKGKDKKYFIPMEVTNETIRDYRINPKDVVWSKIGFKRVRTILVEATKEQYYAYMRPLWREAKREERENKYLETKMVSLDYLLDEFEFEIVDESVSIEESIIRKELIEKLYSLIEELEELDKKIINLLLEGKTEREIESTVKVCQKTVNNRKQKIFFTLKGKLEEYR